MSEPAINEAALRSHVTRLQCQGYTILRNAIPPDIVAEARERILRLLPEHGVTPTGMPDDFPSRDINRLWEVDGFFEPFMNLPGVFDLASAYMNDDITLLGGAITQLTPGGTAARGSWHRDGDYVRVTCLLSDVPETRGPTAIFPGSHREEGRPPAWFNTDANQPRTIDGQDLFTGQAGDCMVNDTNVWHTATPNRDSEPRLLVWIVYKRAGQPVTDHVQLQNTQAFVDRLKDPQRRRLMAAAP